MRGGPSEAIPLLPPLLASHVSACRKGQMAPAGLWWMARTESSSIAWGPRAIVSTPCGIRRGAFSFVPYSGSEIRTTCTLQCAFAVTSDAAERHRASDCWPGPGAPNAMRSTLLLRVSSSSVLRGAQRLDHAATVGPRARSRGWTQCRRRTMCSRWMPGSSGGAAIRSPRTTETQISRNSGLSEASARWSASARRMPGIIGMHGVHRHHHDRGGRTAPARASAGARSSRAAPPTSGAPGRARSRAAASSPAPSAPPERGRASRKPRAQRIGSAFPYVSRQRRTTFLGPRRHFRCRLRGLGRVEPNAIALPRHRLRRAEGQLTGAHLVSITPRAKRSLRGR